MDSQRYVPDKTILEMFLTGKSRLNRWRYFKRAVVVLIIYNLLSIPLVFMGIDINNPSIVACAYVVVPLLLFLIIGYRLDVRRLHDAGKGKTLAVVSVIVNFASVLSLFALIVSIPIALYILLTPGTHGANEYGPDPLGEMNN